MHSPAPPPTQGPWSSTSAHSSIFHNFLQTPSASIFPTIFLSSAKSALSVCVCWHFWFSEAFPEAPSSAWKMHRTFFTPTTKNKKKWHATPKVGDNFPQENHPHDKLGAKAPPTFPNLISRREKKENARAPQQREKFCTERCEILIWTGAQSGKINHHQHHHFHLAFRRRRRPFYTTWTGVFCAMALLSKTNRID